MATFGANKEAFSRSDRYAPGQHGATVADLVREGVRKAREKLIDLSMRNTMLNFRHSETSAKHVRIVDEDLELLVGALASRTSLDIIPIPPVEQVPRDEETDEFRAALKLAKETDPDWLAAEDARRAAGNRRRAKDKAAERALRDRVRTKLGMPEWRVATDPRARARELGIDPSYDLPPSKDASPRHHADNSLQTLLFPDRLEPKLASINSTARALQEDAGLSALYIAVGFLEWYEQDDSADPAYAPLVLLPVNMEKRIASGEYIYSIVGRDDDEASTVALREKLVETAADVVGDAWVRHHLRPVQKQIVVIEDVMLLLGPYVCGEKVLEFIGPAAAPRIVRSKHLLQFGFGVDAARVDRKARAFGRKPAFGLRETALVPNEIHQIGRVLAIVNGERGIETDLVGIFAEQPGTNTVEGAGPAECVGYDAGIVAQDLAGDPFDPFRHFGRGASRERHQQNPARVGAADDEVGDTVGEGVRLARSGACDDQEGRSDVTVGSDAVLDGSPLLRIECLKI
jgi:hypothetical protein